MYYSKELSMAYLAAPRTASRAVSKMLMAHGFERVGNHHDIDHALVEKCRISFTIVRNHFDAIVSWWSDEAPKLADAGKPEMYDFETWFRKLFLRRKAGAWDYIDIDERGNHLMWLRWAKGCPKDTHHILLYEKLDRDLPRVLPFDCGMEWDGDLIQARHGRPYQQFYTPEMAAAVALTFYAEAHQYPYYFGLEEKRWRSRPQ